MQEYRNGNFSFTNGGKELCIMDHKQERPIISKISDYDNSFIKCLLSLGEIYPASYSIKIPFLFRLFLFILLTLKCAENLGIRAIGFNALNIARIETGFIMANSDFIASEHAVRNDRAKKPDEIGMSWMVDMTKQYFNGKTAIQKARENNENKFFWLKDVIFTFTNSPGLQLSDSNITGVIYLVLPKYFSFSSSLFSTSTSQFCLR